MTDPLANLTHLGFVVVCVFIVHRIPQMCIHGLAFGIVFGDLGDPWVALGGGGVRCVAGQAPSGGTAGRLACMLARVVRGRFSVVLQAMIVQTVARR